MCSAYDVGFGRKVSREAAVLRDVLQVWPLGVNYPRQTAPARLKALDIQGISCDFKARWALQSGFYVTSNRAWVP